MSRSSFCTNATRKRRARSTGTVRLVYSRTCAIPSTEYIYRGGSENSPTQLGLISRTDWPTYSKTEDSVAYLLVVSANNSPSHANRY